MIKDEADHEKVYFCIFINNSFCYDDVFCTSEI